MPNCYTEEHGRGSFGWEWRDNGLLLYQIEGDLGEDSALPWELARVVGHHVVDFQPQHIAFDLTGVECFYGAPVGFLARPCNPVRAAGGKVYLILGPDHSPRVRSLLELVRILGSTITAGAFDNIEAVERVIADCPSIPEPQKEDIARAKGKANAPATVGSQA